MGPAVVHEVAHEKFERALALLEAEQNAMRLSGAQKRSLQLYTVFVWCFLSLVIISLIYGVALEIERVPPVSRHVHEVVIGLFAIGAFFCVVAALVVLFLNIPVIVKFERNKRRFRRLGLFDDSESLWREYQKTHRGSAIFRKISFGLGIVLFLPGVVSLIGAESEGESKWFVLMYFVPALLFVMFGVLQICKAWLEIMELRSQNATHLKDLITDSKNSAQQAGLERIPVPVEAIKQLARIETVQIARSRAEAIAQSNTEPIGGFSILLSQQVLKIKGELQAENRLKVEDALDALMLQPEPSSAEKDADTGSLRQHVNGTELDLIYDIDETARRVKVISLRQPMVGGKPSA